MENYTIDALAMVREIRDQIYEITKDMTAEEEIRFFQEESAKFRAERAEERRLAGREPRS